MFKKKAFRVYLICCAIVVLAGVIMILRQETTYATIHSKTSSYKGPFNGWQVLICGAMMAIVAFWGRQDSNKEQ
jgi:hypothetical protein